MQGGGIKDRRLELGMSLTQSDCLSNLVYLLYSWLCRDVGVCKKIKYSLVMIFTMNISYSHNNKAHPRVFLIAKITHHTAELTKREV